MPSFLVTRDMSPALAARVMASVSGRRSGAGRDGKRSLKAVLRVATFVLLATSIGLVASYRQHARDELRAAREAMLRSARSAGSTLTPEDRGLLQRIEAAVALHAAPTYEGDFIADELKDGERFAAALKRPTLYVRGAREGFPGPGALARLARESSKDAFVLCWLDPPEARTEQALRAKARAAAGRGKSMDVAAGVERLAPLFQALPFLGKDWEKQVETAETTVVLAALRRKFDAAPLAAAVRAAKARQLLLVIDEAGDGKGPTELDGERPHPVRVVLTDLVSSEVSLRFRQRVDPSWISASVRAEHARGIDSCALALDLRAAAFGEREAGPGKTRAQIATLR